MSEKQEKLAQVEEILREHGIAMNLWGCGCCGSPVLVFEYNGERVFDDDRVSLKMIEEQK